MPHSATYKGDEVEVNVKLLRETEDAFQFDIGRNQPVWLAKSMILSSTTEGDKTVTITVSLKVAEEKGLV